MDRPSLADLESFLGNSPSCQMPRRTSAAMCHAFWAPTPDCVLLCRMPFVLPVVNGWIENPRFNKHADSTILQVVLSSSRI
jgi:hypothetical protein